jgi:hypothetical protein
MKPNFRMESTVAIDKDFHDTKADKISVVEDFLQTE